MDSSHAVVVARGFNRGKTQPIDKGLLTPEGTCNSFDCHSFQLYPPRSISSRLALLIRARETTDGEACHATELLVVPALRPAGADHALLGRSQSAFYRFRQ